MQIPRSTNRDGTHRSARGEGAGEGETRGKKKRGEGEEGRGGRPGEGRGGKMERYSPTTTPPLLSARDDRSWGFFAWKHPIHSLRRACLGSSIDFPNLRICIGALGEISLRPAGASDSPPHALFAPTSIVSSDHGDYIASLPHHARAEFQRSGLPLARWRVSMKTMSTFRPIISVRRRWRMQHPGTHSRPGRQSAAQRRGFGRANG